MKKIFTFISVLFLSLTLVTFNADKNIELLANVVPVEGETAQEENSELVEIRRSLLGNVINYRKNQLLTDVELDEYSKEGFKVLEAALVAANKSFTTNDKVTDQPGETKLEEIDFHLGELSRFFELPLEAAISELEDAITAAEEYIWKFTEDEEGINVKTGFNEENVQKYVDSDITDLEEGQPIIKVAHNLIETAKESLNSKDEKAVREVIKTITTEELNKKLEEELDDAKEALLDKVTFAKNKEGKYELVIPETLNDKNKEKYEELVSGLVEVNETTGVKSLHKDVNAEGFSYDDLQKNLKELSLTTDLSLLKEERKVFVQGENNVKKYGQEIVDKVKVIIDNAQLEGTISGENLTAELNKLLKVELDKLQALITKVRNYSVEHGFNQLEEVFTEASIKKLFGATAKEEGETRTDSEEDSKLADAQAFVNLGVASDKVKIADILRHIEDITLENALEYIATDNISGIEDKIYTKDENNEEVIYSKVYTLNSIKEMEAKIEEFREKTETVPASKVDFKAIKDLTDIFALELKEEPLGENETKILVEVVDTEALRDLINNNNEYLSKDDQEKYNEIAANTNITEKELETAIKNLTDLIISNLLDKVEESIVNAKEYYLEVIVPNIYNNMKKVIEVRTFILEAEKVKSLENIHTIEILKEVLAKLTIDNIENYVVGPEGANLELTELDEKVKKIAEEALNAKLKELFGKDSNITISEADKFDAESLKAYNDQLAEFEELDETNTWREHSKGLESILEKISGLKEKQVLTVEDLEDAIKTARDFKENNSTNLVDSGKKLGDAITAAEDALTELSMGENPITDPLKVDEIVQRHVKALNEGKEDTILAKLKVELQDYINSTSKLLEENNGIINWDEQKDDDEGKDPKEKLVELLDEAQKLVDETNDITQHTQLSDAKKKIAAHLRTLNLITDEAKETLEKQIVIAKKYVMDEITSLGVPGVDAAVKKFNQLVKEAETLLANETSTYDEINEKITKLSIEMLNKDIFNELPIGKEKLKENLDALTKKSENKDLVDASIEQSKTGIGFDVSFTLKKALEDYKVNIQHVLKELMSAGITELHYPMENDKSVILKLVLNDKNEIKIEEEFLEAVKENLTVEGDSVTLEFSAIYELVVYKTNDGLKDVEHKVTRKMDFSAKITFFKDVPSEDK